MIGLWILLQNGGEEREKLSQGFWRGAERQVVESAERIARENGLQVTNVNYKPTTTDIHFRLTIYLSVEGEGDPRVLVVSRGDVRFFATDPRIMGKIEARFRSELR